MDKKIIICAIIFLLVSFIFIINIMEDEKIKEEKSERVYQGPVPEGYDEDYFRRTGITQPLDKNN